jgi:hypothetical protein
MMSMPLSRKQISFRRGQPVPIADAPVYAAPRASSKPADDVEALRRILREHASRWQ